MQSTVERRTTEYLYEAMRSNLEHIRETALLRLKSMKTWHFIIWAVILSEVLTAAMNVMMSYVWWGHLSIDLIRIGVIDSFVVSLLVATILVFMVQKRFEITFRHGARPARKTVLEHEADGLGNLGRGRSHEDAFPDSSVFLNSVFDSIRDPFCIIDRNYHIVKCNDAYAVMRNRTMDELMGARCHEVLWNRGAVCDDCIVQRTFESADPCAKEKAVPAPDGFESWYEILTYPVANERGEVSFVLQYNRDITERKKSEIEKQQLIRELELRSRIDSLTGILNRRALFEKLEKEENRIKRYASGLALILCDIDHFKTVNDTFGHDAGDAVLIGVAETIRSKLRSTDAVGRYGGDEFMLILPQTSREGALALAERIRASVEHAEFRAPGNGGVRATLSFGVALFSSGVDDAHGLIKRADSALYVAKREGKNRIHIAAW